MIRALPIVLLGLFFAWLALNVSTLVLWLIAGASLLALIALIMIMYWKDSFVGPHTLVDDAKRLSKSISRTRESEDDREDLDSELPREDIEEALGRAFEADGRRPVFKNNVTPLEGDR